MATDLDGIFNVGLKGCRDMKVFDKWLDELKKIQLPVAKYRDAKGNCREETGEWEYEIGGFGGDDPLDDEPDIPYKVSFYGPYMFSVHLMDDIAEIPTHYRLKLLFEQQDFFESFIEDIHKVLRVFGGTEVTWLSSLGTASYSRIFQCEVWENVPYEEVKKSLIKEYGQPMNYEEAKKYGEDVFKAYEELDRFVVDKFA